MSCGNYSEEFRDVFVHCSVNPYSQDEIAEAARLLGHDEFAEFVDEISEDFFLIEAERWFNQFEIQTTGAPVIVKT